MGMLEGQAAIVTGAAHGMGRAIATRFAREGARVLLTDVLEEDGRAAAAAIGGDSAFFKLDVRSEDQWTDAVEKALGLWGPVTILVNNAGIAQLAPLSLMSLEDYRRTIDINQVGVFLGMKACVPSMRRAGNGAIINNSSIGGLFGQTGFGAYNASKHAVLGMTKAAALELAEHRIRVNAICPGGIETEMHTRSIGSEMLDMDANSQAHYPLGRMGSTEEVAALCAFLASDESGYVSGACIPIDGAWTAGYRMVLKEEYR